VTGRIASAIHIPELAYAVAARGLRLVSMAETAPAEDMAALIHGCANPAAAIAEARARGWTGPLMVALSGGSVARALDAGADDAVHLPADAEEIAARLAARLRIASVILIGDLRIDCIARSVTRAGRPIALLPREYALLLYLAHRHGRCVSRAELLAQIWRLRFDPGTNVVQVHVSRLRAKLDRDFPVPMLRTRKGEGYVLTA
jgi:two-component system OmpR family response regulator